MILPNFRLLFCLALIILITGPQKGNCQINPLDSIIGPVVYEFEVEIPFYQIMLTYAADQASLQTLHVAIELSKAAQKQPSALLPSQLKNCVDFYFKEKPFHTLFDLQDSSGKLQNNKRTLAFFDSLLNETSQQTAKVLEKRLRAINVDKLTVDCKNANCTVRFWSEHPRSVLLRMIVDPGKIEIWRTIGNSQKDQRGLQLLNNINRALQPSDSFSNNWLYQYIHLAKSIDGTQIESPYVGYVSKSDTAYVNELLASARELQAIPDAVTYLWGKEPLGNSELFALYFLQQSASGKAAIYGDFIADAKASKSAYGEHMEITVKTKNHAAIRWRKITKQAAQNQGFIAISIDNFVYVAPRVISEIPNGMFVISLQTDVTEAKHIAHLLRFGSLPLACNILNE